MQDDVFIYEAVPPQNAGYSKRFLFHLYNRFIRIRGTPERIAWGAAIGFFVAMTPTMGIQTYIVVPLAAILGVSKLSAALAVWITNPLTAPFLYGFNYMIGAMILGYPLKMNVFSNTSWSVLFHSGQQVFYALWIGGFVTGIILGIAGYFLAEGIIITAREKSEKLKKLKDSEKLQKIKQKVQSSASELKKLKEKIPVEKLRRKGDTPK
ncbi:MAG: hypothetical protein OMM_00900 [Candidatus Magnetoglobus multicellularis str. Araruama]|uniref:DUF2062 domain-containing protein n=1 Tax=Candidatus Magnetoglobus multicellularis str. Araruama TaxID=890399 RepID=A0A1V1PF21_9BACT|nr:MAG: hypothetical protein OMM_00900 [Candidatus Magnetoglobus multicellularis str. Araruama]